MLKALCSIQESIADLSSRVCQIESTNNSKKVAKGHSGESDTEASDDDDTSSSGSSTSEQEDKPNDLARVMEVPKRGASRTRKDIFILQQKTATERLKVERNRIEANAILDTIQIFLKGSLNPHTRKGLAMMAARICELQELEEHGPSYAHGFGKELRLKGKNQTLLASSHKAGLLAQNASARPSGSKPHQGRKKFHPGAQDRKKRNGAQTQDKKA